MEQLPDQTISRLPIYLRCLDQARATGMTVINSLQLAQMAGTNAAQVRKDLSYLGELGTRGVGYDVGAVIAHVSDVLGLSGRRRVAIVGFGRLGGALLGYRGFGDRGFDIVAAFDIDPTRAGQLVDKRGDVSGVTVQGIADLEADLRAFAVEIVILATPADAAQAMAGRIAAAGVKSILNFTPTRLELPADVRVRAVDLSVELQVLSFYLAQTN